MNERLRATGILAIRPEPGLSSTLALGREFGFDIRGTPLFEIRPRHWKGPDPADIDVLLIGSANAILHGGSELVRYREKPVHAVGKATARAAKEAGFEVAATGSGGLQSVIETVAPPARLLRIAGAEHVALDVPEGIAVTTRTAYESVALPLDAASFEKLGDYPLILLHSAAAAAHFASECDRLEIERSGIALAALGPRIASAAGKDWRAIHVAPAPSDGEMLASLREVCI